MKEERILLQTGTHSAEGILRIPDSAKSTGVILAHGAGSDMNSEFMRFFHDQMSNAGYPCLKFNFPYSQKGKRAPDPQPVLTAIYREAIKAMSYTRVVIGGKSMGGRIASYVADAPSVQGLVFLGYPLHPPGKPDQLRDEHLYAIKKSMLFVSGTRDPFARQDLLENTLRRIGKYALHYPVENGGHSLDVPRKSSGISNKDILNQVAQQIIDWIEKL